MNRLLSRASIFLVLVLGVPSCGPLQGTNTGNPSHLHQGSALMTVAWSVVSRLCAKINSCVPGADVPACQKQLSNETGFTAELGNISTNYSTMAELSFAESGGVVITNSDKARGCFQALQDLTCEDPLLALSYQSSDPGNFRKINRLLRASSDCQEIF